MGDSDRQKGVTLLELIVVVAIVAILAFALFRIIETTYKSWRTADRRVELLQIGRVAMDLLTRETRKAHDMADVSDPDYFGFYPDRATDTPHRFYFDSAANDFQFVNIGSATDSIAAPMDSFEYLTYTRSVTTGTTDFRKVNALKFVFAVSDERRILDEGKGALNLNPMTFRSFSQIRSNREGWMLSLTSAFATDTTVYSSKSSDDICGKIYCDRVDPANITKQTLEITWKKGAMAPAKNLAQNTARDFWWACANTVADGIQASPYPGSNNTVKLTITDNTGETCVYEDKIWVISNF
ncbi:MAG TPA: prepilin-type N-terminal cleavage/methylation domain-containing protein [bacterium]|nr:prepilin-type N-terminal cleavage/methylation domain-containing protein [bacterium]